MQQLNYTSSFNVIFSLILFEGFVTTRRIPLHRLSGKVRYLSKCQLFVLDYPEIKSSTESWSKTSRHCDDVGYVSKATEVYSKTEFLGKKQKKTFQQDSI